MIHTQHRRMFNLDMMFDLLRINCLQQTSADFSFVQDYLRQFVCSAMPLEEKRRVMLRFFPGIASEGFKELKVVELLTNVPFGLSDAKERLWECRSTSKGKVVLMNKNCESEVCLGRWKQTRHVGWVSKLVVVLLLLELSSLLLLPFDSKASKIEYIPCCPKSLYHDVSKRMQQASGLPIREISMIWSCVMRWGAEVTSLKSIWECFLRSNAEQKMISDTPGGVQAYCLLQA